MKLSTNALVLVIAVFYLNVQDISSDSNEIEVTSRSIIDEINEGGDHDAALDEYFMGVLDGFRIVMPIGFPDFGIPQLDPLSLDEQDIRFRNENSDVSVQLRNLTVRGISKFDVPFLRVSLPNFRWQLAIIVPEVYANGTYSLSGTGGYVLPLKGRGNWKVRIVNLTIGVVLQLTQDNEKIKIRMSKLIGNMETFDSHFDNLLSDGNLSIIINSIIRKQSKTFMARVLDELRTMTDSYLDRITDLIDASIFTEFGENRDKSK